jgi:hypothetical protein
MTMLTADELLHAPGLKMERARHHINDFNTRIDAFLAERPSKLIERFQYQAGKRTLRVKAEKPVSEDFSLIVGDAIHNLRAALDLTLLRWLDTSLQKFTFPSQGKRSVWKRPFTTDM